MGKPHYDCASWSGVGNGKFEKTGTALEGAVTVPLP